MNWSALLRQMRMIHFAMLMAAFVQLYVLYGIISPHPSNSPDLIVSYAILSVGLVDFVSVLVLRTILFKKAAPLLQANPMDSAGQAHWRVATIASSAFAFSIFLFGYVVAFIGGEKMVSYMLWGLAAVAFVMFIPQSPIDEVLQANLPPDVQIKGPGIG